MEKGFLHIMKGSFSALKKERKTNAAKNITTLKKPTPSSSNITVTQ